MLVGWGVKESLFTETSGNVLFTGSGRNVLVTESSGNILSIDSGSDVLFTVISIWRSFTGKNIQPIKIQQCHEFIIVHVMQSRAVALRVHV